MRRHCRVSLLLLWWKSSRSCRGKRVRRHRWRGFFMFLLMRIRGWDLRDFRWERSWLSLEMNGLIQQVQKGAFTVDCVAGVYDMLGAASYLRWIMWTTGPRQAVHSISRRTAKTSYVPGEVAEIRILFPNIGCAIPWLPTFPRLLKLEF